MPPADCQDPDDYIRRPASFIRMVGTAVEKTFIIRGDWSLAQDRRLGELIVNENINGALISVVVDVE